MNETVNLFAKSMREIFGVLPPRKLGISVSGGVDSMALATLTSRWAQTRGVRLQAYIVDHRLRPESSQEASEVSQYIQSALNVNASILPLTDLRRAATDDPSKTEELARHARRNVLLKACEENNHQHLLMAHHLNDQMELFVQRLLSGSSWFGLAGMRSEAPMSLVRPLNTPGLPVRLVRPLLNFPKSQLIAWCQDQNIRWWEDHTNQDTTLTSRNLIRKMYTLQQEPECVSASIMPELLAHLGKQRDEVLRSAELVHRQLLLNGQLDYQSHLGTANLTVSSDICALPLFTISELLMRIIAPISPLSEDKLMTRRRKLDDIALQLKEQRELVTGTRLEEREETNINVLGIKISPQYKLNKLKWRFAREVPRQNQLPAELFKATPKWSDWVLIDNRWNVRWKLPEAEQPDRAKYFSVRLVEDPRPILTLLSPHLAEKPLNRLRNSVRTHPLFMWSDPLAPHTLDGETLIGYPTLGIASNLDVEVQPKECSF